MEYAATVAILLIVLGPIAWALTAGRRSSASRIEDREGASVIGEHIRRQNTDWR